MNSFNFTITPQLKKDDGVDHSVAKKIEEQQKNDGSTQYSIQNALNYEKLMKELSKKK